MGRKEEVGLLYGLGALTCTADRINLKQSLLQRHDGISQTLKASASGPQKSVVKSKELSERTAIPFMILFREKTLGSTSGLHSWGAGRKEVKGCLKTSPLQKERLFYGRIS